MLYAHIFVPIRFWLLEFVLCGNYIHHKRGHLPITVQNDHARWPAALCIFSFISGGVISVIISGQSICRDDHFALYIYIYKIRRRELLKPDKPCMLLGGTCHKEGDNRLP